MVLPREVLRLCWSHTPAAVYFPKISPDMNSSPNIITASIVNEADVNIKQVESEEGEGNFRTLSLILVRAPKLIKGATAPTFHALDSQTFSDTSGTSIMSLPDLYIDFAKRE